MSTTRLMALHTGKGRSVSMAIRDVIDYVENPKKTDHSQLISSYQCSARVADKEFLLAKKLYIQKTGRTRGTDDVIAYHLRQSFVPGEITPEEANRLGRELAMRFTKGNNAFIVCTHIDKAHIHNHIIVNAVNLDCNRKFRNFWGSTNALRRLNDTLCVENGYSIVENPHQHGQSYNKWQGERTDPSHREHLCFIIDEALKHKPKDFDALLVLLRQAGYEIKGNPANPSLRGGEQKRFIRLDTLGSGYSVADLKAVIIGERQHGPKQCKGKVQKNPQRTNQLLIDIQAKLVQGKGAGYAYWAKKFNLKQMAKTVAFLQEQNLMDYAALAERAEAASAQYRKLSERIKTAETRMAEVAGLRTQIVNYARTRETYVAYRKAGYSKKFKAEHEADILLHQAAKKHFDALDLKKLPQIRTLNAEYAKLLSEKKAAYGDYRQIREEWKELLTAKANIDRILGKDATVHIIQKERPSEQR